MRLLLDSNAYSLLMRGHEPVAELVRSAQELLFSAVVVGELMYGFRAGSRFERNIADLRSLLESPYATFAAVGRTTADRYCGLQVIAGQTVANTCSRADGGVQYGSEAEFG